MSHKYKAILRNKIVDIAPSFDLEHILFSSFIRQIDNKTQISASDMVYSITSLLESPSPVMVGKAGQIDENKKIYEDQKDEDDEEEGIRDLDKVQETQIDNFWASYKSLDIK
jgi:hypothetical protein